MKPQGSIKTYLTTTLVTGLASLVLLLLIPGDPKNAWLLSLSKSRMIMFGVGILSVGIIAIFTRVILKDETKYTRITQKVEDILSEDGPLTTSLIFSSAGLVWGIHLLIVTFTSTDQFLLGYFIRLAPWIFWLTAICGQNLFFIIFNNPTRFKSFFRKLGWALLTMSLILIAGFIMHDWFWGLEPEDWDRHRMFNQDNKFVLDQQDIHFVFIEGDRLQQGQNPYARVLDYNDNLQWNHGNATYFPILYYLSWLTQEIGLEDFLVWLGFWRIIFLIFNLGIAYLLFYIPYFHTNSIALASLSALFWLFNRWTMHISMIYHIEFIAIFFFLVSLFLWPKNKKLSLLAFGLSLGVKQIAIFMIPIYVIWIWQSVEDRSMKNFIGYILIMGAIPLIVSAPFLIWNAEGFIKSVLISATRNPESHFGIPSFDVLMGWRGIPAKLPMLGLMFITFFLVWKKKINQFVAALFIMVIFVDFNSVLFRQYMAWVVPLIPLSVSSLLTKTSKLE